MKVFLGTLLCVATMTLPALAQAQPSAPTTQAQPSAPATAQPAAPATQGQPAAAATTQAQESYTVTPPTGWVKRDVSMSLGSVRTLAVWANPAVSEMASFNLVSEQAQGRSLGEYVDSAKQTWLKAYGADSITDSRAATICGGSQNAWFIASSMSMGTLALAVEQMITVHGGTAFVATYVRKADTQEDTAARKALDTLCAL